jgi:hypothetical protein
MFRTGQRWENIKNYKDMECDGVGWIQMAEGMVH